MSFHCWFTILSHIVLGIAFFKKKYLPFLGLPSPLWVLFGWGRVRRTSRSLCLALCVSYDSGWLKEGERQEWRLVLCSSLGSTSDPPAGETTLAGAAGKFQQQPREDLATLVFPVVLCQSGIVPLFIKIPGKEIQ